MIGGVDVDVDVASSPLLLSLLLLPFCCADGEVDLSTLLGSYFGVSWNRISLVNEWMAIFGWEAAAAATAAIIDGVRDDGGCSRLFIRMIFVENCVF